MKEEADIKSVKISLVKASQRTVAATGISERLLTKQIVN